jgi:rare lipoprotein A
MRIALLLFLFYMLFRTPAFAQSKAVRNMSDSMRFEVTNGKIKFKSLYGVASYYADKFNGRQTATGAIYSHWKMTAACNKLPLNTWIRVTNLRNKRSVIVQVNDRLHPKNPRLVDMSRMAAEKLGYTGRGLTQVKVEVLVRKSSH